MSANRDGDHDAEKEDRINALKQQAEQAAGGTVTPWESDTLSPDARERFWRHVIDYETAPVGTDFQQLTEVGIELPQPDTMDDAQVTPKLWEVIQGLAKLRVFLNATDHLSDRELYARLWHIVLRDETSILPFDPLGAWHVNLIGDGDEESARLYLKYYASEDARRDWLEEWPDYDMPAREALPYDRDRLLPGPYDNWTINRPTRNQL